MNIPPELVNQFVRGNGVIFVGAGLSTGAGLPGWMDLIRPLARAVDARWPGDEADLTTDHLLTAAQYYENQRGRNALIQHLRDTLDTAGIQPTSVHRLVASLPVRAIFTTNYDNLIERALQDAGQRPNVIVSEAELAFWNEERVQVVKLCGDLNRPESIVITKRDFNTYFATHSRLAERLRSTLEIKTALFLGYSLQDPFFNQIWDNIGLDFGRHRRMGYTILFDVQPLEADDLQQRGIHVTNLKTQGEDRTELLLEWLSPVKVLETAEEEQRKAKIAKEAFELAVTTWQTEQVLESSQKLDWFYQHAHNLDIGANELFFLLLSETQSRSRDPFSQIFRFSQPDIHSKRLRWINLASLTVCIQVLDMFLLVSSGDTEETQTRALEIITDLCDASSFEVQKELVAKLEEVKQQPTGSLYRRAYQASPIPNQDSLSYLQDIALGDLPSDTRQVIAYRILEHYHNTFPAPLGLRYQAGRTILDWVNQFPVKLLDSEAFRNTAFDYLKQSSRPSYPFICKLLYDRDPDRTIGTLWDMVDLSYIGKTDSEILQLLRIYDPQRTIEQVVRTLSQESRFHSETSVALLEAMKAPEADDLLIKDLERYVQRFERGSKWWRGRIMSYWRESIRRTVQVVARHRLETAEHYLATIVLRYEPENVKLDCMDALISIGGKTVVEVFVKLLDDRFAKVRNKASRHLLEMNQRDTIVTEIIKSISEQEDRRHTHQAKRSDAMKRKINTLYKLHATQATEVLEQVALNDDDESIQKSATRVIKALRRMQDPA